MNPQLESLLTKPCDAATIQSIQQLSRDWYEDHPEAAGLFIDDPRQSPAANWCRAAILEAVGRKDEAAAILEALPDLAWGDARALRLLAMARNAGSFSNLRSAMQCADSYRILVAADKLLARLRKSGAPPAKRKCRIALVGAVTLEFWPPALRAACFAAGIDAEIFTGAFGQFQQEILDSSSPLAAFRPEVVIIASDWRSMGIADECTNAGALITEKIDSFTQLWRVCRERFGAFVIHHNFEIPAHDPLGRLSAALPGGRARVLQQLNLALWDAEREHAGVAILDLEQTAATVGKTAWEDPKLWLTAKQSPATLAIPILVRRQTAIVRAALGIASKCLVLDLDGTLWGGVVGEDGPHGIVLGGSAEGEAYVEFQRYVRALQRRGIPLAVCSKNNDADARAPFREHPEMALALEDITVFLANWESKALNLRHVAAALNIGIDSLVFVDDNRVERELIRRELPDVEVPEMPGDPALYMQALDEQRYFEAVSLTREDRERVASYRENAERKVLETSSASVEEFLRSLQMKVELRPFDQANLPRISQLINKTNQFNLTTRRMSAAEVATLLDHPSCYTQFMRLSDRFGDSGLTGVLIALEEGDSLRIDNWLLSCRVLGRRIEDLMLRGAQRYACHRGLRWIDGAYIPTAKNAQVRDLFERFGFDLLREGPDGARYYRRPAEAAAMTAPDVCELLDETEIDAHTRPARTTCLS